MDLSSSVAFWQSLLNMFTSCPLLERLDNVYAKRSWVVTWLRSASKVPKNCRWIISGSLLATNKQTGSFSNSCPTTLDYSAHQTHPLLHADLWFIPLGVLLLDLTHYLQRCSQMQSRNFNCYPHLANSFLFFLITVLGYTRLLLLCSNFLAVAQVPLPLAAPSNALHQCLAPW